MGDNGTFNNADEILESIDCNLFRQQRLTLINIIGEAKANNGMVHIGLCYQDDLEGLESLLDDVADYMADVMGKTGVLLTENEPEGDEVPGDNREKNYGP